MSLYLFQTDSATLGTAACVSRPGFLTLLPALKEHRLVAACHCCTDISIRVQTLNVIGIQVAFKWTLRGFYYCTFRNIWVLVCLHQATETLYPTFPPMHLDNVLQYVHSLRLSRFQTSSLTCRISLFLYLFAISKPKVNPKDIIWWLHQGYYYHVVILRTPQKPLCKSFHRLSRKICTKCLVCLCVCCTFKASIEIFKWCLICLLSCDQKKKSSIWISSFISTNTRSCAYMYILVFETLHSVIYLLKQAISLFMWILRYLLEMSLQSYSDSIKWIIFVELIFICK